MEEIKISELKQDNINANKGTETGKKLIKKSIKNHGAGRSILIDKNNRIIAGNKATENCIEEGINDVIIVETDGTKLVAVKRTDIDLDTKKGRELALADNATSAANLNWDSGAISNITEKWGIDSEEWDLPQFNDENNNSKHNKLSDQFIIPPFSILDTKQGEWQDRKRYWLSLGIKSEEGRDAKAYTQNDAILQDGTKFSTNMKQDGTSIFDPVLCELVYKWFNVPNGKILDCFAGGSVRGIVAAKLGYDYLGNDLRGEQIEANQINAKEVLQDAKIYPCWTCGDSLHIDTIAKGYEADLLFSCPPYADLEVYSNMKEDISNMPYNEFIKVYREIISKSCKILKNDRFAVFVVGDVRDKNGYYRNFVSDTIKAFIDSGLHLYNEMILVNMIGNLAMRAARYFNGGRKIGKQHQNVLVFYKGNPKNIKLNYPKIDLSYIKESIDSEDDNVMNI